MSRLVVDASAIAEALGGSLSFRVPMQAAGTDLHAPFLCDVEVVSTLFRQLRRVEGFTETRGRQFLEDYLELPIERHGHLPYVARALELRDKFTAYDAMYVALSEALEAALLTADSRLAGAARRHTNVRVLPE